MKNTTLYKNFFVAINGSNPEQKPLSIALSGGVDSVVLLHLCYTLREQISGYVIEAIYIDHGLSADSDKWRDFCQRLCESLDIDFKTAAVEVKAKARHSLEAQARDARYAALDSLAMVNSLIVLGQHGDDQLETFLLRLKRGSGLDGLTSMRTQRILDSGRVCIRPLLNASREDIEAFARMFAIEHIEDNSNKDDRFDRNFLRNQVIPLLKSRFRGFLPSALRSIDILQQQQGLIEEITQQDLRQCSAGKNRLDLQQLDALSKLRQANVVRAWLASCNEKMPSKVQLEQLLHQALTSKQDAQVNILMGRGCVKKHRGLLYFVVAQDAPNACFDIALEPITLNDGRALSVEHGKGIRLPASNERVSIQFGLLNAKIRPCNKPGRNTVKHWLKEAGVPSWQRAQVPLIFYDEQLVQIVGYYFEHSMYVAKQGIRWEVIDG
ncbi:tRNA lysidine(34) synthetase TilS [Pseudoalteromonas sp. S16_S37]|uniref:tRNA lysidine(34) synthetase TilS n=1 Tax=Pseudoalteromonas sp. S16_S37 TaxID=2720228 RepID=UPI0016809A45|nr:tRNA lysidine(34) synthetase TilS [Pseudoalteromonas sp. S16_S37]MBD1583665.1 tRNA lysidine(34) synthetase TilS [Pseudoalteromonas sp. S16_S37]